MSRFWVELCTREVGTVMLYLMSVPAPKTAFCSSWEGQKCVGAQTRLKIWTRVLPSKQLCRLPQWQLDLGVLESSSANRLIQCHRSKLNELIACLPNPSALPWHSLLVC